MHSVLPSGGDFAHSTAAGMVLPPARLITTTGWPSRSDRCFAISRAAMSVTEPAAIGTISRIGCALLCAEAGSAAAHMTRRYSERHGRCDATCGSSFPPGALSVDAPCRELKPRAAARSDTTCIAMRVIPRAPSVPSHDRTLRSSRFGCGNSALRMCRRSSPSKRIWRTCSPPTQLSFQAASTLVVTTPSFSR